MTGLTSETRIDPSGIYVPNADEGIHHRVTVSVQKIHIQRVGDASLCLCNI